MYKDPCERTLWRGVALDLESVYKAKLRKTVDCWGITGTTSLMEALDASIPADSPQERIWASSLKLLVCRLEARFQEERFAQLKRIGCTDLPKRQHEFTQPMPRAW